MAGSRVGGLASRPSKKPTRKPGSTHSNNRIKITSKDKLLYKDDYYLEKRVSHKEAHRLYEKFRREMIQIDCATSWAGVVQ